MEFFLQEKTEHEKKILSSKQKQKNKQTNQKMTF